MSRQAPLPMKNGVTPSRLYLPKDGHWRFLFDFLKDRFSYMDAEILAKRLKAGEMVDQHGQPFSLDSVYIPDSWLWYYRVVEQEKTVPFKMPILFQDELLIVVDKPHFLASVPAGRYVQETALTRLRKLFNQPEITPIHRLDRETAGVLVFCVQAKYRGNYQQLFQKQRIEKNYEAIAKTITKVNFPYEYKSNLQRADNYFAMQEVVKLTPNSSTRITSIKTSQDYSHYLLQPITGKKHQLRVHMKALGSPIINDRLYAESLNDTAKDSFEDPLQLLARSIRFIDPITQKIRYFKSQRQLALTHLVY